MIRDRRCSPPAALAVGGLLLFTLACGKKAGAPEDGTGTPTIQAAPDDIVPDSAADSDTTPGAPVAPSASPSTGKPATVSAPTGGAVIGYDSAFGPSYELDSAGRPIPIKKRKP